MKVISVSLPHDLEEFVAEQVKAGGHASASDYILHLLREAQREKAEEELEKLVLPALESLERGEGKEMTSADWERLRQRLRDKHSAAAKP